jgi:hypothetical protein
MLDWMGRQIYVDALGNRLGRQPDHTGETSGVTVSIASARQQIALQALAHSWRQQKVTRSNPPFMFMAGLSVPGLT